MSAFTRAVLRCSLGASLCLVPFAFSVAGESDDDARPQSCLLHSSLRRTEIIDSRHIAFVERRGTYYVNELVRECPTLRRNSVVSYPIANGRLCSGSIVTVVWQLGDERMPAFTCQLGVFLPRTEEEVAELKALAGDARNSRRRRTARDMIETVPVELEPAAEPAPATPATTESP